MKKITFLFGCLVSFCCLKPVYAQEKNTSYNISPIQQMRAEESYSFLEENDSAKLFLRALKRIQLSKKKAFCCL